ncbi:MAG: hypothetical protein HQ514_02765 [Rhodospirillales bacterium]|nr:hypothetical protein [Rhodospirillales bacterium]
MFSFLDAFIPLLTLFNARIVPTGRYLYYFKYINALAGYLMAKTAVRPASDAAWHGRFFPVTACSAAPFRPVNKKFTLLVQFIPNINYGQTS